MNKCLAFLSLLLTAASSLPAQKVYHEQYRPQIHFSPMEKWTNDPNGMIYNKGTYHLFFQYYPDSTVWGPMHWGHAVSTDLVHWKQLPIALYPDKLGYIFSGSAVADVKNTSGLGKNGKTPLVAIFTHHDPVGEKKGTNIFQNQSLAYSLDDGYTWLKYPGNPVLKNPGITDFRDPKVFWYAPGNKWLMTLAVKDHISFYSSADLKSWKKESDFGSKEGAHGGVWECPDLLSFDLNGKKVWVLIVNINPGGPNKGSATQYFTGSFDGKTFVPNDDKIKWLDYGPDEYAGVTWGNTGNRKIFLGWMSNWLYAQKVPTLKWRNAMTLPRDLYVTKADGLIRVGSRPAAEINQLNGKVSSLQSLDVNGLQSLKNISGDLNGPFSVALEAPANKDFEIIIKNSREEQLIIGWRKSDNQFYIDRTHAGQSDFDSTFSGKFFADRFSHDSLIKLKLYFDAAAVELFADDGLSVMTATFFPVQPLNQLYLKAADPVKITNIHITHFKSIWP